MTRFKLRKDYSILADTGAVIRVTGMREYRVEMSHHCVDVPVDYSGGEETYFNIWVAGSRLNGEMCDAIGTDVKTKDAIELLSEYLVSRSTRVRIVWGDGSEEWREPTSVPFVDRLSNWFAKMWFQK